ncbi:integrin alpha-X-like isoform X1 [Astyanax mexicanus]|uniref:integrin alpha-X-like isoform X1 n=1 Tax=Astyanax mexicanus TaxID=7994 RepID=UPI0020CAD22A|nr:integrin alpha-X-like isoform X1 [Astyanax mexicanus]
MEVLVLVVWAGWALSLSDGFNMDVTDPEIFSGSQKDFFGYQVLQYQSDSHKQILVSAPLTSNQSGAVYSCAVNTVNCTQLNRQDSEDARFFGMSLAASSTPSPVLTSCSPSVTRDCDGNSYLSGICYNFNSKLQTTSKNNIGVQECTKGPVNLVFLFDGSSSMKSSDFNLNKKFIWDIITQLQNSTITFAAVQFSGDHRTVFTFKDYMEKTAKQKLDNEQHMQHLTNTHRAIDYVLVSHFNNVSSGADPDATKALVIITDGTPTDFNTQNVIKRCEDQRILRFVIGVGNLNLNNLKVFASDPKDKNTFMIQDYGGLDGLLFNLQNKIYTIEGGVLNRKRTKELSQSGFSAVYIEETLVLGAVGSNDWRGSLYEVLGSGTGATEEEIKDPGMDNDLYMDSYLGYSVVGGQRGGVSLLFSGAPRANHTGRVIFFIKHKETWSVQTSITGEQVGSYFGASLCLLDVDVDGAADFLVIGAPQYYQAQPQSEGRMYVYRITDQMMLEEVQKVSENVLGQFAASVTSVADLNGDELQDVAVGAPLEDDGRGAVYIYLGNQSQGVRPKYSQRILARTISEELKQFGVAIDGSMDLNEDRLTDLVVGARGTMILLKARPVLSVSAQLSYSPSEINLDHFDCGIKPEKFIPVMTLEICFSVTENTHSTGGVSGGLNVSFELNADAVRGGSRAFFELDDKNSRSVLRSVLLSSNQHCSNQTLYMKSCVRDTLLPVFIRLNFSQSEDQTLGSTAVLNIDSRTQATVEVPFQRNCQSNTSCVADLQLDFSFTNSTLLVVDQAYFIINVTLLNKGDDSFNTTVVLHYPPGLSLSMSEIVKATRRTLISCGDRDDGALDKTTCSISLPVYRKGTSATFQAKFRISRFYEWNETMEMTIVARSENNGNFTDGIVKKSLPVQFAVDVAIILVPESSVTYLNFSLEDKGPKKVILTYKVSNLGLKGLPVSVNFMMPSQISQNFSLKEHKVLQNNTKCEIKEEKNLDSCPGQMSCVRVDCHSFDLDAGSSVEFELEAQLTFLNPQLYTGRWSFHEFGLEEKFSSSAQLIFNRNRFNQISSSPEDDGSRFHRVKVSVKAELVIPPDMYLIVSSGGFAGLLLLILFILLLWKCGFFKRKRPDDQGEMYGDLETSEKAELQPKDQEEEIQPLTETQNQKPQEQ